MLHLMVDACSPATARHTMLFKTHSASVYGIDAYRVEGCLVRIWFVPEFRGGKCYFRCDSDAVTLKAVIGLLSEIYSGHSPEEIAAADMAFVRKLGILHQLAENRQNTILRVAEQIRSFGVAHQRLAA